MVWMYPQRFVLMMFCQSSRVVFWMGPVMQMPALLMRMSMWGKVSRAFWMRFLTCWASLVSVGMGRAFWPVF